MAYLVLRLKNITHTQFESLRGILNLKSATYEVEVNETLAEGFKDCEELRNLLEKMLSLDSKKLPELKEMLIKQDEMCISPTLNVEESKQTQGDKQVKSIQIKTKKARGDLIRLILFAPFLIPFCFFLIWSCFLQFFSLDSINQTLEIPQSCSHIAHTKITGLA